MEVATARFLLYCDVHNILQKNKNVGEIGSIHQLLFGFWDYYEVIYIKKNICTDEFVYNKIYGVLLFHANFILLIHLQLMLL